ncbi:mechanosensitive ion channel family protein [Candidatus Woesearchaeota archaeon]|nr:mechanosensitive ion channel family protein [Candidatus Woesearchaeota archaeon]
MVPQDILAQIMTLLPNEYLRALVLLAGSFIAGSLVHFILRTYVKHLTHKTKSDIDDIILEIVTKPFYFFVIFTGVYLALQTLNALQDYYVILDQIFFVGIVLITTYVVSKILAVFIGRWLKVKKQFEKTPQVLNKVVTVVIYILAFLTILSHFEINVTPLITTLGLGGLAVGLALQNTLMNFFAGLHLISDKPVNVGDFIETESKMSGYVEDIGWRATRIRTLSNTIVIIPNGKLAESVITNLSLPEENVIVRIECGVAYNSDLKKVEKITLDVAKKIQTTVKGTVKNYDPAVQFHTFGESNILFSVRLRVQHWEDKLHVQHEFIKALKERYDREKIEISFPVRKIYTVQ